MAGLLGAIYDHKLEKSGQVIKSPTERLSHVDGTPRGKFVPRQLRGNMPWRSSKAPANQLYL